MRKKPSEAHFEKFSMMRWKTAICASVLRETRREPNELARYSSSKFGHIDQLSNKPMFLHYRRRDESIEKAFLAFEFCCSSTRKRLAKRRKAVPRPLFQQFQQTMAQNSTRLWLSFQCIFKRLTTATYFCPSEILW